MLCQHSYSHAHILFECICWFDNFLLTLLLNGNYFHLTNGKGLCEVTTSIHLSACVWIIGRLKDFPSLEFSLQLNGFCLPLFLHISTCRWLNAATSFVYRWAHCTWNAHVQCTMYMHIKMPYGENNCIKEQHTQSHTCNHNKWDARMIMI